MAVEALGHAPRPPGAPPLTRLGASLSTASSSRRATVSSARPCARRPRAADRQRVVLQMVRVGTDTLLIGALLSSRRHDDGGAGGRSVREVSRNPGPIVGLAMTKELGPC